MTTHPSQPQVTPQVAPLVPQRMRAAVRETYGPVDGVRLQQVPVPRPGPGQVLVEVHAAGLDRGVWHLMTGLPYLVRLAGYGVRRPRQPVLGADVAGRVAAVGEAVTRFSVGDEVFGIGNGTFAEFALAEQDKLVLKPPALSFVDAAAMAISGLTAAQALHEVGRVQPGQHVLVLGASGGVGSFAVQLARAAGAQVTGVCSTGKTDLVRSLGANQVIDHTRADATDGAVRYELILDIGGRTPVRRLRRALRPDGTLVIVGGEGGGRWTGGVGRQLRAMLRSPFLRQRLTTFICREDLAGLERLRAAVLAGQLAPVVGRTYPLQDLPQAIRDLEAGRARGKSVIRVRAAE